MKKSNNPNKVIATTPSLEHSGSESKFGDGPLAIISADNAPIDLDKMRILMSDLAPQLDAGGTFVYPNILICRDSRHEYVNEIAANSRDDYNLFVDRLSVPTTVRSITYEDGHYYLCEATYDQDKKVSHLAITDSLQSKKSERDYPQLLEAEQSPFNGLDPACITFHKNLMQQRGSNDCGPIAICNLIMERLPIVLSEQQRRSYLPTDFIRPLFAQIIEDGGTSLQMFTEVIHGPIFLGQLMPVPGHESLSLTTASSAQGLFKPSGVAAHLSTLDLQVIMTLADLGYRDHEQNMHILDGLTDRPASLDDVVWQVVSEHARLEIATAKIEAEGQCLTDEGRAAIRQGAEFASSMINKPATINSGSKRFEQAAEACMAGVSDSKDRSSISAFFRRVFEIVVRAILALIGLSSRQSDLSAEQVSAKKPTNR